MKTILCYIKKYILLLILLVNLSINCKDFPLVFNSPEDAELICPIVCHNSHDEAGVLDWNKQWTNKSITLENGQKLKIGVCGCEVINKKSLS